MKTKKTENNIDIPGIFKLLANTDNILILTHIRPDGDTIGSAYGLKKALENLSKTVYVSCADDIPGRLLFLTDETIIPDEFIPSFILAVDTATLNLLGENGTLYKNRIDLKIDHHTMCDRPAEDNYADYNYVNEKKASCGEIIFEIISLLGTIDNISATKIYAACASDTGCFKYNNTTSQTHMTAAKLIDCGADIYTVNTLLFESMTRGEIKAANVTYSALKFYHGGDLATICFTNKMKEENGLSSEDISDITSIPRRIEGVKIGIVLKQSEHEPNIFKISIRSAPGIAANELCAMFGGGGHPAAAGAVIESDDGETAMENVLRAVFDKLNWDFFD